MRWYGVRIPVVLLVCTLASCVPPRTVQNTAAQAGPCEHLASIGETFAIDSKVLGERRVINVYVPPDYATTPGQRYPVLFMPDGGLKEDFQHVVGSVDISIKNLVIRPMIVVGVENTDRRHDLTGPTQTREERDAAPRAGGADTFRRFFRDELKPYVAAHYRTTGESALIGESLAGLFVIETFLVEPTLFDSYIAADPSVQWNSQAVVRSAPVHLATWPQTPKHLYIATGDLPEMQQGVAILVDALRGASSAKITWIYDPMPAEHHNTIFAIAALRGVRALFSTSTTAP